MEINIEIDNITPRKDVISLLVYAKSLGKHIILVSDMYLTKKQIISLLDKCGINKEKFNDIYISSECSKDKYSGKLWEYIREKYDKLAILHFGDNEVSDGKKAIENEIDYLPIHSGLKVATTLLDNNWMKYEGSFQSRYAIGTFISDIFNSPFRVSKNGKITIETLEEIGRIFLGPVIKCFLDNLYASAKQKKQKIIFQARDCWILKKIADKYYNEYEIDNVYLLTSRRAIALVNIKNEEDIKQVFRIFSINTKHTFQRFCEVIFNISTKANDKYNEIYVSEISVDELEKHLLDNYEESIISASAKQNLYFNKYIKDIGIDKNEPLAIVNFVGSGLTQMFFEKNGFKTNSEYYYFAINKAKVSGNSSTMIAVFGESSNFTGSQNAIAERTIWGECIFTSPQTQFMGFDENGQFCFAENNVNNMYSDIQFVHKGIEKYFERNFKYYFSNEAHNIVNIIYGYLFDKSVFYITDNIRSAFKINDIVKSDEIQDICK